MTQSSFKNNITIQTKPKKCTIDFFEEPCKLWLSIEHASASPHHTNYYIWEDVFAFKHFLLHLCSSVKKNERGLINGCNFQLENNYKDYLTVIIIIIITILRL